MLGDGTVRWRGSSIERKLVGQQIVVGRNELALSIETGQVVDFAPLEYTIRGRKNSILGYGKAVFDVA